MRTITDDTPAANLLRPTKRTLPCMSSARQLIDVMPVDSLIQDDTQRDGVDA